MINEFDEVQINFESKIRENQCEETQLNDAISIEVQRLNDLIRQAARQKGDSAEKTLNDEVELFII